MCLFIIFLRSRTMKPGVPLGLRIYYRYTYINAYNNVSSRYNYIHCAGGWGCLQRINEGGWGRGRYQPT